MVYFMHAEGTPFVKIGRSIGVETSLSDFQVGCPYELKLILEIESDESASDLELEKETHRIFKDYRHRGEWFYFSKYMRNWINAYLFVDGHYRKEVLWG